MLIQIPAGVVRAFAAVGDTFQLAPAVAERKSIFDVDSPLGVVRQLFAGMFVAAQVFRPNAELVIPALTRGDPVLEPFFIAARLDEVFDFHCLELERAEHEVTRRNLVAECLANLRDAKREFAAHRGGHIGKVDEHALCGFGTEISHVVRVVERADLCPKHSVEHARLAEHTAAIRALCSADLIGAIAILAFTQTLDERVGELFDVP